MSKEELIQKVDSALNSVRPHLAVDGGDVEIVEISDDMKVYVKWLGNCELCSMSAMTMKAGIERAIISKVPTITEVVAVNGVDVA
ncbi:NifU family protein [Membranihabitans maritimus]|uniref:NifU family protein n=1 Tax=Membranihabitans maritimus TaxID=2904244 RepID=UPI001F23ED7F|nr:NifU family protein [Membranihabitans maritimus]